MTTPPTIRDGGHDAALLPVLDAWFDDLAGRVVEHRRSRLGAAREAERVRAESERARLEHEARAEEIAEARRWQKFEEKNPEYVRWRARQG